MGNVLELLEVPCANAHTRMVRAAKENQLDKVREHWVREATGFPPYTTRGNEDVGLQLDWRERVSKENPRESELENGQSIGYGHSHDHRPKGVPASRQEVNIIHYLA